MQERVKEGHLKVVPIRGQNNPADLFTKAVSGKLRAEFLKTLGFEHKAANLKQKHILCFDVKSSRGLPREAPSRGQPRVMCN